MNRTSLICLVWFLSGTAGLHAQHVVPPIPDEPAQPAEVRQTSGLSAVQAPAPRFDLAAPCPTLTGPGFRIWTNVEYLRWNVRNGSLPPITTGDPTALGFPGALGQPSTRLVFDGDAGFGLLNGGRVAVGAWLNEVVGVEVSAFLLEEKVGRVTVASDAAGNPFLAFPFFRSELGREGSFSIANRTIPLSGGADESLRLQLWGAEANLLLRGYTSSNLAVNWLAGFRYADLREDARIRSDGAAQATGVAFQQTLLDTFAAQNQFYGGQVGATLEYYQRWFGLALTAKAAFGSNHQTLAIAGQDTQSGPGAFPGPGALNEGLFAQRSNSGRFNENHFSVIPQVQGKVSVDIVPHVTAFAGYDFLYWSSVVRAGDQIDRNINLSQSQVFGAGALAGPADPSAAFRRNGFIAHGVSFGLAVQY